MARTSAQQYIEDSVKEEPINAEVDSRSSKEMVITGCTKVSLVVTMEEVNGKCSKESSQNEITIKTEMKEFAQSATYIDIEIDLNHIKEEPYSVDIVKIEPELPTKYELLEHSWQDVNVQQRFQHTSTNIVARNADMNNGLNIKTEPEDSLATHQRPDPHGTNQLDMNGAKQASTVNNYTSGLKQTNRLKRKVTKSLRRTLSPAYICDYCGKSCHSRATLVNHMKKFHGSVSYSCTECKINFVNEQYLTSHNKKLHPLEQPKCEFCKKLFKNNTRLGRHFRSVHSQKSADALRSQLYKCDQCLTVSKTKATLKLHYKRVHGKESHKCTECNKQYKCKEYLVNHMSYAHSAEKYECIVCKVVCKSKQALFNHLSRLHRPGFQPRIYICDYCHRTFRVRSTIQIHLASVHESKTYKCDRCNKNFKCKQYLTLHSVRCNVALTETCNICCKSVRPGYLKQHTRYMHDDKNFQCKVCGIIMRSKLYLRLHVNNLHGQQSTAVGDEQPNKSASTIAIVGDVNMTGSSSDQRDRLEIKPELRDADLDIGPTILQHVDSHYRFNQVKVEHLSPVHEQIVKKELGTSAKRDITVCRLSPI